MLAETPRMKFKWKFFGGVFILTDTSISAVIQIVIHTQLVSDGTGQRARWLFKHMWASLRHWDFNDVVLIREESWLRVPIPSSTYGVQKFFTVLSLLPIKDLAEEAGAIFGIVLAPLRLRLILNTHIDHVFGLVLVLKIAASPQLVVLVVVKLLLFALFERDYRRVDWVKRRWSIQLALLLGLSIEFFSVLRISFERGRGGKICCFTFLNCHRLCSWIDDPR